MEKRLRVSVNAANAPDAISIPPQNAYNKPNWRPWQLSPFFLVPLIFTSAALAVTLEVLAQISNETYRNEDLQTEWLNWYCEGQRRDSNSSCIPNIPGLSVSELTFENISDSKTGILAFLRPDALSSASTFAWLYLPTLLAVFYALFWQVVDDEVKRIEPFYQASRPTGARGDRTIFASYISIPPILAPVQALRWRQVAVFLSSITYVLVGFVTPILQSQIFQLQSQMIQVGYFPRFIDRFEPLTRQGFTFEHQADDSPIMGRFTDEIANFADLAELQNEGIPRIVVHVDPTFARAQEAILWAATLSGSLLLWVTMRRQSGLRNDIKGLAALASVASAHPAFLDGIAAMVAGGGSEEAEDVLKQTVVHLGWGQDNAQGSTFYGLWFRPWPTEHSKPMSTWTALLEVPKKFGVLLQRRVLGSSSGTHHQILRYSIGLSQLGNLLLIVLILVIGGTEKPLNTPEDAFRQTIRSANRNNGIVLAAIDLITVSIIKTLWVVVEEQTTVLTPYRSLHTHGPQKAWPLLERDYAAIVPGLRTFRAFQDGQFLLGCVTSISLLLEVCLFCFGITASMSQGTAYNADAIWTVHWIAFTVCVTSIVFIAATNRIWLSGFPYLERNPDTIAAKLTYVCRSTRLLEDVRPAAVMTEEERKAHLRGIKGRYALGQVQDGVLGVERVAGVSC
ncbi:hypothetical protein DL771_006158 [Monosporascus sp. 5C6A]|nr:hypothetical protein DL771_006158 [Monosporascus sp. 5C6A]